VYQQDLGIDDNGSDFDFYIKTSDFDFGNPIEKKVLKRLYLTLKTEAVTGQDINLTVKYYINGSTTAYSLQSVNLNESVENGYFIAKFPVNENLPATFNWLAVSVEYDGKQGPVSIYQIRAIYKKLRYE
jgi:hypothetical protein